LANVTVRETETATFVCKMNKENAQPVKWFKAGVEILPNDAKYKFLVEGNQYSLQILDCQLNDADDYAVAYRGRKCAAQLEVKGIKNNFLNIIKLNLKLFTINYLKNRASGRHTQTIDEHQCVRKARDSARVRVQSTER
jgi:hypothetical protein